MKLLVCGISALELWDSGIARRAHPTNIVSLGAFGPDLGRLASLSPRQMGLKEPCEILVPPGTPRICNSRWLGRYWSGAILPGSIFSIGRGLYITSPEICYLQMAPRLGVIDSAKLAMELCGPYSTIVAPGSWYLERPALTSKDALSSYLVKSGLGSVNSHARRALVFAADDIESPMEGAMKLFVNLPYRYGCPGFPEGEINHEVPLTPEESRMLDKGKLRCDEFWGFKKRALEYKGELSHSGEPNLRKDTARENILRSKGITVINATYDSLSTEKGFEALCLALSKGLGKRLRIPDNGYLQRQAATRNEILRGGTCTWTNHPGLPSRFK